MSFRTWSANGRGRRTRRSTVVAVAGVALATLLALATAALAWFPVGSDPEPQEEPRPATSGVDDSAADDSDDPIDLVWRCPVQGRAEFRDDYGYRKPSGRIHRGVDLYAPLGTPVVAPRSGTVERSEGGTAGKQVTLHAEGSRYVFAHLSRFGEDGQVEAGEEIGYVGTTGNAEGATPHLHFEMRDEDGTSNPYPLLHEHCR